MLDRFSKGARKVMGLARDEARRLNHDYIGTEHILLGFTAHGESAATAMLAGMGVSVAALRAEVERRAAPGSAAANEGTLPFTPAAKKALECAHEEMEALGADHIGTTQLLLGLLRVEGVAAQALAAVGVSYAGVRERIGKPLTEPPQKPVRLPIKLTDGMLATYQQKNGNVLEVVAEGGILYVTDRAEGARVGATAGCKHTFILHSWIDPPQPAKSSES